MEVAFVSVAEAFGKAILAGGDVLRAGTALVEVAGVEGLLKREIRGDDVLLREIGGEVVGDDDGVISLVEVGEVATVFTEGGQHLPAESVA